MLEGASALFCFARPAADGLGSGQDAHGLAGGPGAPLHGARRRVRALCHPRRAGWRLGAGLRLARPGPDHRWRRRHVRAHGRRLDQASPLFRRSARSGDRLRDLCVRAGAGAVAGGLLGGGGFGVVLASLILLSSLFHFSDTESKSDDHCFVGFPAIWNIVAFYVFAFRMPTWAAALLVLACVALTFVPLRWAHPAAHAAAVARHAGADGIVGVGRISHALVGVFPPAPTRKPFCCWRPPTASALRCCAAGDAEKVLEPRCRPAGGSSSALVGLIELCWSRTKAACRALWSNGSASLQKA